MDGYFIVIIIRPCVCTCSSSFSPGDERTVENSRIIITRIDSFRLGKEREIDRRLLGKFDYHDSVVVLCVIMYKNKRWIHLIVFGKLAHFMVVA